MNIDYIINSKYCPALKKNVPVMEFLNDSHTKKCWNERQCGVCRIWDTKTGKDNLKDLSK